METVQQSGYREQLQVHGLSAPQYLHAAQRAMEELNWQLVAYNDQALVAYTPGDNYVTGEQVVVTTENDTAFFYSIPHNEYYSYDAQHTRNAALYKQALATVLAADEKARRSMHPMHREKYGALIPSKTYLVTPLLVYLNVLVFIAMVIAGISPTDPHADSLFDWGGNARAAVVDGGWWRLITYMFLHAGIVHLAMNMYALLYIGMFLEPLLGRFRFASAYILTGICAGLLSITMHDNSVGVGASGAIFGMYGVFLAVLTTGHIEKTMRKTMLRSILFFVVFNLLYGLRGNIDNAAHVGGLLGGILVGYIYYPGMAKRVPFRSQLVATIFSASLVLMLVLFVLTTI